MKDFLENPLTIIVCGLVVWIQFVIFDFIVNSFTVTDFVILSCDGVVIGWNLHKYLQNK